MASSAGPSKGPLYRKGGAIVRLGVRLGSGGEGEVWELPDEPTCVVKLYRRPDESRRRKIESMLAAVPDDPQRRRNHVSICWPDDLILDAAGGMAGFTMPRMDLKRFKPAAIYWDAHDRAMFTPGFTWKYLCVAAANIASVVDMIHARGHVIGDLNDENFLLSESALATVVDCDSMQIRCPSTGELFRSHVTREPYLSPEWMGKKLADHDRSPKDDNWALAVLVFQLLMEGQHPANGIGFPEERRDRIRQGIFPMLGAPGFQPPRDAHPLTMLSPELQALTRQCFEEGYSNADARPTAHEWKAALNSFAGSLHQCTYVGEHWYGAHHSVCPWCEEKSRKGYDRFAFDSLNSGLQTQLSPAGRPVSTGSAAPVSAPSVSPSAAAVPPHSAQSSSPSAGVMIVVVLAIIGVIFAISLSSSGGSGSRSQSGSTSSHESNGATYSQPTAAAQPETSQPAVAAQPEPSRQATTVSPIPYQPAASPITYNYNPIGTHVSFSYPANWTATQNKDGSARVCQDGATRPTANGDWCYYEVSFGLAGATTTEGQPLTEAQVLTVLSTSLLNDGSKVISNSPNSNLERGGLEVIQTVQTPLGYVEKRVFRIWPFSTYFAWSAIGAPEDQWNTAYPMIDRIYRSAKFQVAAQPEPSQQATTVSPIPYQPAASPITYNYNPIGTHVSFSYPANWTATQNKDGSARVCQDGATRSTANGNWCYYEVSFGLAGATTTEGQPLTEAQVLTVLSTSLFLNDGSKAISNSPNSNLERGGLEVIQTVQTPWGYVEKRMFRIWPFSTYFAWSAIVAPEDQWSTAYPMIDRIYRSAKFR